MWRAGRRVVRRVQDGEETVGQALLIAAVSAGVLSASSLAKLATTGMETLLTALR